MCQFAFLICRMMKPNPLKKNLLLGGTRHFRCSVHTHTHTHTHILSHILYTVHYIYTCYIIYMHALAAVEAILKQQTGRCAGKVVVKIGTNEVAAANTAAASADTTAAAAASADTAVEDFAET